MRCAKGSETRKRHLDNGRPFCVWLHGCVKVSQNLIKSIEQLNKLSNSTFDVPKVKELVHETLIILDPFVSCYIAVFKWRSF